jgi:hypothetical protein
MARQMHDYFAVAVAIARRHYRPLLARFREDLIQECHLLAWEAEVRRAITVRSGTKRKRFGSGSRKKRLGLKAFTRACNARFYLFRKQYYSY